MNTNIYLLYKLNFDNNHLITIKMKKNHKIHFFLNFLIFIFYPLIRIKETYNIIYFNIIKIYISSFYFSPKNIFLNMMIFLKFIYFSYLLFSYLFCSSYLSTREWRTEPIGRASQRAPRPRRTINSQKNK